MILKKGEEGKGEGKEREHKEDTHATQHRPMLAFMHARASVCCCVWHASGAHPELVLESAPITTPPSNSTAMMVVWEKRAPRD